ncbi:MAG: PAS domain-containing protein [Alphaproteobacteria bacterium]|nr:PAS domain-containing protein [Alphaproteobacteria bacterium]
MRLLIVLVAAISLGLLATHVIQMRIDREHETVHEHQDLQNITVALASLTMQTLGSVDETLVRLGGEVDLRGSPAALHDKLRASREASAAVREYYITDADGRLLASSDSVSPAAIDMSTEPPFMDPTEGTQASLRISPPLKGHVGRAADRTVIRLARRWTGDDGKPQGWSVATVDVDYFREMFDRFTLMPRTAVALFREDGVLLATTAAETTGAIGPAQREAMFRKQLLHATTAGTFWSGDSGEERSMVVYTRVPGLPLVLVAQMPESEIYADWRERAITASAIDLVLVACIIAATMLVVRIMQLRQRQESETTRRLNRLAAASIDISRERISDRVLSRAAEIARDLVPSHQSVVSLTVSADFAQAVHTVSLSDKYARWRDYDEMADGSGIYRLVCKENRPYRMTQQALERHPAWKHFGDARDRHPPMRGWLAVPLAAQDGNNLGLIQLSDRMEGEYTEQDEAVIVQLAQLVSAAVEIVQLLESRTEALRTAEAARDEIARIFSAMSDGLFHLDPAWRFTRVNRAAEEMLDAAEADLVGRPLWDVYPQLRDTRVWTEFHRAADTGRPATFENHFKPVDRHFLIRLFPGDDGLAVYVSDVTEQRRIEQQLQQAQKMEAVGQLTGGIAHDFNNLLTVIMGNTDMLLELAESDPRYRTIAEMIQEAASRGADLTHRLLAFSRRQPLEPRVVDANQLVTNLEGLLRRTLRENIDLELVRAAGLWKALVDRSQLESAVINLAINARDAMPDGGKLTIETANARLDDAYAAAHDEVRPGQYVMIALSDTGEGMDEETLERAFDPFFTTKPVGKGSGLGLSMVYGFVKQSGGHVKLYSEPGLGTTVKLYLPRAGDRSAPADARPPDFAALPRGSERIAVVEDEELVRRFTSANLTDLGYQVSSHATGPDLLQAMDEGLEFDLLFTDVVLPGGLNGRDIAEAVAQRLPRVKILYSSGYTDNAIVHHGRLDDGVHLLNKPFRKAELAQKVRAVLDDGDG